MRDIDNIIEDWKIEFGIKTDGGWGEYYYIDFKQNRDLVYLLAQIIIEEGYRKEDLVDEDGRVNALIQKKVVDACEAPAGKSTRKPKSIQKTKGLTAINWRFALKRIFLKPTKLPQKEKEEPKTEAKKEKPLEIIPSDRIKMDVSDMKEIPMAEDLLSELAAMGSIVGVKNE